jgi:hypothetical protein
MRSSFLLLLLSLALPAHADWDDYDYQEERELALDAGGLEFLRIDAGAGSLAVRGVDGSGQIEVRATVLVSGAEGDKARDFIEKSMVLSLDRAGNNAELVADFKDGMGFGNDRGAIALDIRLPTGINVDIDDGSGSIEVRGTESALLINDGSGSITVSDVADVRIDDGSGSIDLKDVSGDVHIDDGSGSIKVSRVAGNIVVDDGSGSINVADVQGSFKVVDAGSGSVNYRDVAGDVSIPGD